VVLRARASSEGAEQSKRAASIQRTSAPPSRPPPPRASGSGSCNAPGSPEGSSQLCSPRASPDASSNPEPAETREKEGAGSSGPEEPRAVSTKSATQASGGLVGLFLVSPCSSGVLEFAG
jgi:hypothetical protein